MPQEDYVKARSALAKHMWRHHQRGWCTGTLAERIAQHDDVHWEFQERGRALGHQHAALADGETLFAVAHRYFEEGEHG